MQIGQSSPAAIFCSIFSKVYTFYATDYLYSTVFITHASNAAFNTALPKNQCAFKFPDEAHASEKL